MKRTAAADNGIRAACTAVVLLLLLFPARYSNSVYAYFPFFTVLLLVTVSVGLTFYIRKNIRVSSDYEDSVCERRSKVPMGLKIHNDSLLICPRAVAWLYISDLLGGEDTITPSTHPVLLKCPYPTSRY